MFNSKSMTREQILSEVQEAFGSLRRPDIFIRGTCGCEECLEHEAEMQTFTPDNLPLDKLDNPGWDPICFASNAAFAYFALGLAKLVLDHANDYIQQFIFHVQQPERLASFTPGQARALVQILDFLLLHEAKALENNLVVEELNRTKGKLEHGAEGDAVNRFCK